jgi:hypothetical protein
MFFFKETYSPLILNYKCVRFISIHVCNVDARERSGDWRSEEETNAYYTSLIM